MKSAKKHEVATTMMTIGGLYISCPPGIEPESNSPADINQSGNHALSVSSEMDLAGFGRAEPFGQATCWFRFGSSFTHDRELQRQNRDMTYPRSQLVVSDEEPGFCHA